MKRFLALALAAVMLLLCACGGEKTGETEYELVTYGRMPTDYTPEEAVADRCLAVRYADPSSSAMPSVEGTENWEYFLAAVDRGEEEIMLRIVYFMDGYCYYSDLSYALGVFNLYTLNEYRHYENLHGGYPYFYRIEGSTAEAGYYVLSHRADLTSDAIASGAVAESEYLVLEFTRYLSANT